ncbi:MAG: GNAT family N-acetyltransferase [Marinicella sp.]
MTVHITAAQKKDAQYISELAIRAKAYWGYSATFMQAVKEELTYSEASITENPTYMAVKNQQVLGFYQLIEIDLTHVELEALFIDPQFIGTQVGTGLFAHAVTYAGAQNYQKMSVQSDPYAEGFYLKQGCVKMGETPSLSISGRMLPMLAYQLKAS